jgi:hypothetical protein
MPTVFREPRKPWTPPSMFVAVVACICWWLAERLDAWRPFE